MAAIIRRPNPVTRSAQDDYAHMDPQTPVTSGAEWAPRLFWQVPGSPPILSQVPPARVGTEVLVYLNHGRWVVECPDCHGAQLACRTDPRFLCVVCGNVAVGGAWRPVVWPAFAQAIDALMEHRPNMTTRNWLPGETLGDLMRENDLQGDIPPDPEEPHPEPLKGD